MKNYRISFSWAEVLEVRRALALIMQEDGSCDVNMEPAAVKAKNSALAKLTKITGKSRLEIALESAESVPLNEIGGPPDRPFGGKIIR